MHYVSAAVSTAALLVGLVSTAQGQVGTPASPRVGSPMSGPSRICLRPAIVGCVTPGVLLWPLPSSTWLPPIEPADNASR